LIANTRPAAYANIRESKLRCGDSSRDFLSILHARVRVVGEVKIASTQYPAMMLASQHFASSVICAVSQSVGTA
jgi:hypothetical protein